MRLVVALESVVGVAVFVALAPVAALSAGCGKEGCLAGEDGCEVPSPCQQLAFQCADPTVELKVISSADEVPGGLDAMGAVGDFLLQNSKVQAVIDALDHPTDLAPTGGAVLDLADRDRDDDAVNHIFQAVGALPEDAVVYEKVRVLDGGTGLVALQFEGHLQGDTRQRVYTRYELRACEPGLRVRTEMVNDGDDTVVWSNADGYWWGGRSMMPFTPTPGEGYFHPSFGLSTLNDVFRDMPFVVGAGHSDPASALAVVGCNVPSLSGFESGQVSANGTKRRIVAPSDYEIYERFLGVAPGTGAQPGVDLALQLRKQLFGEAFATVGGTVALDGGRADALGEHIRASVQIYEGTLDEPRDALIPWTEVVPDGDGKFTADVPADRTYVFEVVAFGDTSSVVQKDVGEGSVDVGELHATAAGDLTLNVDIDGVADHAQVFVLPGDDDTASKVTQKYFRTGPDCAPLLGNPFGPSPACNRVLIDGPVTVDLPPGTYDLYATAGMFASVQKKTVDVTSGSSQELTFNLGRIAPPPGTLSGDFHVHGAKSFDSTIPDIDRVEAFLAAGIDVIIATDHDALWDYKAAIDALHADDRITLVTGVETTGQRLFKLNPSVYFPQVIGHWIMWPLPFDDEAPRKGAPDDEGVEPGALFSRAAARGYDVQNGVIQLPHPWANLEFGRDLGFPRAIGLRLDREVPRVFDGTGPGLFFNTPAGSAFSNADFDAQEVVNGTNAELMLAYRALWLWELKQGIVRAGTANSDSHSLTDNVLGTPRNIVFTQTTHDDFDLATFNADVRAGHMIGTDGPIVEAELHNGTAILRPGRDPVVPEADAVLHVKVHAAPWVPVREVRVLVNGGGDQVLVFSGDDIDQPTDPFATVDAVRFERDIPLSTLLPSGRRDAFIVVEAGDPLPATGDLDCDAVPDTTDNNGDGVIDYRDVDRNGDGKVDATDSAGLDGPEPCHDNYGANASVDRPAIGPLLNPAPPDRSDPTFAFYAVTPGGISYGFTNPFILDVNEDGVYSGPGL